MTGIFCFFMTVLTFITPMSATAMSLTEQLSITQKTLVPLTIQAPHYIRGRIKSDVPLDSIVVLNSQGHIEKQFSQAGSQEADIFWLVKTSDRYKFYIKPHKANTANVTINIHSLDLKKNQFVSPKQKITSPLLLTTEQKIKQGSSHSEVLFWKEIEKKGTPLIEQSTDGKTLLTFLYHGKASNVRVLGAPYDGHAHLSQIAHSAIWFKTYEIPRNTFFSYRIAPNVPQLAEKNWAEQRRAVLATAQPDPLNHHPLFAQNDSLFGAASTIALPQAPSNRITQDLNYPKGKVTDYIYHSKILNNSRKISIYHPHNAYSFSKDSPLLILFDGDDYLTKVPTPLILDNLIAEGKIPPMSAVFINTPVPSLRRKELTPNKKYADFLANEFKPWLCHEHGICPNANNTILSGSSFGGLASLFIAFQYPTLFGNVLSQSGSFWWSPQKALDPDSPHKNWLADLIQSVPKEPITVYLNAGLFETKPNFHSIMGSNKYLFNSLKTNGYNVYFEKIASGHDYFSWRIKLAKGLTTLFHDKNNK